MNLLVNFSVVYFVRMNKSKSADCRSFTVVRRESQGDRCLGWLPSDWVSSMKCLIGTISRSRGLSVNYRLYGNIGRAGLSPRGAHAKFIGGPLSPSHSIPILHFLNTDYLQ